MTGKESLEADARSRWRLRWWIPLVAWLLLPAAAAGLGLTMVLSAGGDPFRSFSDPIHMESAPRVVLAGETSEQAAAVYHVLDRFSQADLDLPALTITFFPSRDGCDGFGGRHRRMGEIEICTSTERMIAHEIAHAWDALNLTDLDRDSYRQLWDAPTWGSHGFEWHERAAELAANTVAFAVLNDDPEPHQRILMYLCTFESLTGRPLPTPVAKPCSPPVRPGQGQSKRR